MRQIKVLPFILCVLAGCSNGGTSPDVSSADGTMGGDSSMPGDATPSDSTMGGDGASTGPCNSGLACVSGAMFAGTLPSGLAPAFTCSTTADASDQPGRGCLVERAHRNVQHPCEPQHAPAWRFRRPRWPWSPAPPQGFRSAGTTRWRPSRR